MTDDKYTRIRGIIEQLNTWLLGDVNDEHLGVSRLEVAQASLDILVHEEREQNKGPSGEGPRYKLETLFDKR